IPSKSEVNAILAKLEGRWRPLIAVALFTGLRSSELRGLPWRDVDLKKATITVTQRADQWGELGPPKSAAGRRTGTLPPIAVQALRDWRIACPRGDAGLVFPNGAGHIEDHSNIVGRGFNPTLIAAGVTVIDPTGAVDADGEPVVLPKYNFHALRHFYA